MPQGATNGSASFEQLVAQAQAAAKRESGNRDDWKPDDGDYFCQLTAQRKGVYRKNNQDVAYLIPVFMIVDHPTLANQEFEGDFMTTRDQKAINRLWDYAETVLGRTITQDELPKALAEIDEMTTAGLFCNVNVKRTSSGGRTFTNVRVRQIVATDVVNAPAEAAVA